MAYGNETAPELACEDIKHGRSPISLPFKEISLVICRDTIANFRRETNRTQEFLEEGVKFNKEPKQLHRRYVNLTSAGANNEEPTPYRIIIFGGITMLNCYGIGETTTKPTIKYVVSFIWERKQD